MTEAETISRLESALDLAGQGFRVFPLAPGTKVPPKGFAWKDEATTDAERIREWWQHDPDFNVGVATGGGVVVVDVDVKDGKPGLASLEMMEVAGLPTSYRVDTPSGGVHVYMKTDRPIGNRVDLADYPGIDVRADGGYVVGPGSVIGGKPYVAKPAPIATADGWLLDILAKGSPPKTAAADRTPLVELDLPENVELAKRYLIDRAPEAIEKAGGDHATYSVACRVRGYGLSEEVAFDLLADHWNDDKAFPPWNPDELRTKVANAYRHATGAWGGETAAGEFADMDTADLDIGVSPIVKRMADDAASDLPVTRASSFANSPVPEREWHVAGLIPAKTVTLLSGDGATGKSLLALMLAAATATGRQWLGRDVGHGGCIYLSAEDDADEVHRRLADIERNFGGSLAKLDKLAIIDLAGKDAVLGMLDSSRSDIKATELFDKVKRYAARTRPRLIILDTLADIFGGEENVRVQARRFVGLLKGLALESGAAIVILAHPSLSGMASGTGTSGSTGWNNSVRSRLYFERVKGQGDIEEDPDRRVLRTKKANYGRAGEVVELRWRDGVFVLVKAGDAESRAAERRVELIFLQLVKAFAAEGRPVSPNPSSTYAPKMFATDGRGQGVAKKAFEAAMNRLFESKEIAAESEGPPSKRRTKIVCLADVEPGFEAVEV